MPVPHIPYLARPSSQAGTGAARQVTRGSHDRRCHRGWWAGWVLVSAGVCHRRHQGPAARGRVDRNWGDRSRGWARPRRSGRQLHRNSVEARPAGGAQDVAGVSARVTRFLQRPAALEHEVRPRSLRFVELRAAREEAARGWAREYKARRAAGLDHSWLTPAACARETALATGGAIRTRGTSLDPYRACLSLASSALERGAVLYESPVARVRAGSKHVEVRTDAAVVKADAVIIATSAPLADLKALRRHLKPRLAYSVVTEALPVPVRRAVGERGAALRVEATAPHFLRW